MHQQMQKFLCFFIFIVLFLTQGCFSPEQPDVLWEFKTGHPVWAIPVVSGHNVYFGSDRFYCLNVETGKPVWDYELYGILQTSAVVGHGFVFFHCGGLYCLEAATGRLVWEFWSGDWGIKTPTVTPDYVYIIIAGKIYCLDIQTGKKIWNVNTYQQGSSPIVSKRYVYVQGKKNLYCLDIHSGRRVRKLAVTGAITSAAVSGDYVYICTEDAALYCIDDVSGNIIWEYVFGLAPRNNPVVQGEYLYVSAERIYCLHALSGKLIWEHGSDIGFSMPAVTQRYMYIRGSDQRIYFFERDTGTPVESFQVPVGRFVVSEGVYLATARINYTVYRLKPPVL